MVPGGTTSYDALTWQIPAAPGGTMSVVGPTTATLGGTGTVAVSWPTDLAAGNYLGEVSHTADGSLDGLTLISVN